MLFVNIGDALFSGLLKVWPEAAAWTKMCHVAPEHFHGGAFNGNSCKVLLEKTDLLQSLCPLDAEPFVQAFRDFKDVVEASFGAFLDKNLHEKITNFKTSYMDLVSLGFIKVTPKVHTVFYHIQEFCSKENVGLGRHSEQASESVHRRFNLIYFKYKVNKSHPEYDLYLLKAVKEFNCSNL